MNLLIIMSDEHTRRMTGCYGHPQVQTPNLDRLAADGVRFDNAYCNFPICVPSRANFLTGRYCHQTGHWDNAHPYIGTEAPSWGHRLAANGNQVTSIGKLHYRADSDDNGIAEKRVSMNVKDGIGDVRGSIRWNTNPNQAAARDVLEAHAADSEYIRFDTAVADETVRWLGDEAKRQSKPWVLFASVVTPHFPFICPPRHWDLYDPETVEMPLAHEQYPRPSLLEPGPTAAAQPARWLRSPARRGGAPRDNRVLGFDLIYGRTGGSDPGRARAERIWPQYAHHLHLRSR